MRKDIEWLKDKTQNRIDKLPHNGVGMYSEGSRDAYQLVLQDINELDEPEVLSQECGTIELEVEDNAEN